MILLIFATWHEPVIYVNYIRKAEECIYYLLFSCLFIW